MSVTHDSQGMAGAVETPRCEDTNKATGPGAAAGVREGHLEPPALRGPLGARRLNLQN